MIDKIPKQQLEEPTSPDGKLAVEKSQKNTETEEKPKKLRPENICYWYEKEKELLGSKKGKAKKFFQLGCVLETEEENKFIVKHIEGYNKTNHQVDPTTNTCSCQSNQRYGNICSHIMAVRLYKFQKEWNI